jgi:hypothetical protein
MLEDLLATIAQPALEGRRVVGALRPLADSGSAC